MIRLDFPGFSGAQSLAPISWDAWFKSFESNNLALMVQDKTARGQRSNFNKLVSRESITEGKAPRRRRKQASTKGRTSSGARSGSTRPSAARSTRSASSRSTSRASASDRSKPTTSAARRSAGKAATSRGARTGATRSKSRK